jgi:2-amino-4-hydroxy-6-hydroxymethyldihydropteridine diphosphokinase
MCERAFVLVPLADIDPDLTIPDKGVVRELLAGVADQAIVPI